MEQEKRLTKEILLTAIADTSNIETQKIAWQRVAKEMMLAPTPLVTGEDLPQIKNFKPEDDRFDAFVSLVKEIDAALKDRFFANLEYFSPGHACVYVAYLMIETNDEDIIDACFDYLKSHQDSSANLVVLKALAVRGIKSKNRIYLDEAIKRIKSPSQKASDSNRMIDWLGWNCKNFHPCFNVFFAIAENFHAESFDEMIVFIRNFIDSDKDYQPDLENCLLKIIAKQKLFGQINLSTEENILTIIKKYPQDSDFVFKILSNVVYFVSKSQQSSYNIYKLTKKFIEFVGEKKNYAEALQVIKNIELTACAAPEIFSFLEAISENAPQEVKKQYAGYFLEVYSKLKFDEKLMNKALAFCAAASEENCNNNIWQKTCDYFPKNITTTNAVMETLRQKPEFLDDLLPYIYLPAKEINAKLIYSLRNLYTNRYEEKIFRLFDKILNLDIAEDVRLILETELIDKCKIHQLGNDELTPALKLVISKRLELEDFRELLQNG